MSNSVIQDWRATHNFTDDPLEAAVQISDHITVMQFGHERHGATGFEFSVMVKGIVTPIAEVLETKIKEQPHVADASFQFIDASKSSQSGYYFSVAIEGPYEKAVHEAAKKLLSKKAVTQAALSFFPQAA